MPVNPDDSTVQESKPAGVAAAQRAPSRWRRHGTTLLTMLLVWLGVQLWQTRDVPGGVAPPFSAPAVAAATDARLSLEQWRAAHPGQPVALYIWADWCPICKLMQSNVDAVARQAPVLTLAMRSGSVEAVRRVLAQRGLNWPTLIDADGQIAARYGVHAVPALIFLRPDGTLSSASVGYTSEWGIRLRLWWAGW